MNKASLPTLSLGAPTRGRQHRRVVLAQSRKPHSPLLRRNMVSLPLNSVLGADARENQLVCSAGHATNVTTSNSGQFVTQTAVVSTTQWSTLHTRPSTSARHLFVMRCPCVLPAMAVGPHSKRLLFFLILLVCNCGLCSTVPLLSQANAHAHRRW